MINWVNGHNSEISCFIDHCLQTHMREIPAYIKDTNDFINKINNFPFPPNSLLVTMDVRSPYTSIPNNEEMDFVKKKYDHYLKRIIPANTITTFIALNNLIFSSTFNLQIKGCARETICVHSYVNIFMWEFEYIYIYIYIYIYLPSNQKQICNIPTLPTHYFNGMD